MAEARDKTLWAHTFGLAAQMTRAFCGKGPTILDFYPFAAELKTDKPVKIRVPATILKGLVDHMIRE